MKKTSSIIFLLLLLCGVSLLFVSCSKKEYISKYELNGVKIVQTEINNTENQIEFNKEYSLDGVQLYFDSNFDDSKKIDNWIEILEDFSLILNEHGINNSITCFFSDNFIANFEIVDGKIKCFMPLNISSEEVLAWILVAEFNKIELPFGIYAGLAAYWLNNKFQPIIPTSLISAGCLTDLQFPLYETDNLSANEREYVWDFSYTIISDWVKSGHNELDFLDLSKSDLDKYIKDKYNIMLPQYSFYPYSSKYEYKIEQDFLTYYVNKQFNDLILPQNLFSTNYKHLSDWLIDNYKSIIGSNSILHMDNMHRINVYLDNGIDSAGISGEANMTNIENYIKIYSAGAFSHEYIHHILFAKGQNGFLREVIPELQANDSKYSNIMWFILFSGQAKYFPYNEEVDEKATYLNTMALYNSKSPQEASVNNFNFWLFADCFAAIHTQVGKKFISRLQADSYYYYIFRVYGGNYVWKANMDNTLLIEGKKDTEIINEWLEYLGNFA